MPGPRPLPGGCMAKGRSHPHLYPVLPQIPLQIVDFHLLCVEDRRGQTGIYCRVIAEQLKEILFFACAAGGDDGHGAACGHGVQQLQIKAVLHAVGVDGVHDQLACAVFDALLQPVQRVNAGVFAPAFGEQLELAMNKWLKILSEHIRVDTADIFQLHSDTDTMNVVCEWRAFCKGR